MPTSPCEAPTVKRKIWFLRVEGGLRQSQWRISEETFNLMFCCSGGKVLHFLVAFIVKRRCRSSEVILVLLRQKLLLSCAVAVSVLIFICVCLASLPRDFLTATIFPFIFVISHSPLFCTVESVTTTVITWLLIPMWIRPVQITEVKIDLFCGSGNKLDFSGTWCTFSRNCDQRLYFFPAMSISH